jgi:DNA-binding CsgD family transcriptional regulator
MLDDLIDDIYRAGFDRDRWPEVMSRMGRYLETEVGYFHAPAVPGSPADALRHYVTLNMDNDWLDTHYYQYAPQDPFTPAMLKQANGDDGRVLEMLASQTDDAPTKTAYYQHYCRTLGIGDVMALMVATSSSRYTPPTIAFAGKWNGGPISADQVSRFQALAPHLRRVGRLMFDVQTVDPALMTSIELLPHSVFLLRDGGSIVAANQRAEAALGGQFGLAARGERLLALRAADDARLQQLLGRATCTAHLAPRTGGEMELTGPDGDSATLIVMPLGGDNPFRELTGPCRGIVYVMPHFDNPVIPGQARLARLFGLTDAEVEVAFALIAGDRPEEIAETRGRSINTVRTQIRNILAKTGRNRISEVGTLVRLVELPLV